MDVAASGSRETGERNEGILKRLRGERSEGVSGEEHRLGTLHHSIPERNRWPTGQKTAKMEGEPSRKWNEESRAGFCAGSVRAEPGAGLAGGAVAARPAVLARTPAVAALPGRGGCAGQGSPGSAGRLPTKFHNEDHRALARSQSASHRQNVR